MNAAIAVIDDVETLIAKVRACHVEAQAQAEKAKAHAGKAIDRALEAGDALLLIKPTVKHGEWETFLQERLPELSVRQAQKYMRIARDLPVEKRTGALLTVNGALRMLEAPKYEDDELNEDKPDARSMVDYHYGFFLKRKSELLNEQMKYEDSKVWNTKDWLFAHKDVRDDRQELRSYALSVINQSSICKRDVITKLMALTIMIDDPKLPIGKAMSALMATGNYRTSIQSLTDCINLMPDNSDAFMDVRSEIKRHYDNSVNAPF